MKISIRFWLIGLACMLVASFLPCVNLQMMNVAATCNGYQAAFWAGTMGFLALLGKLDYPFWKNINFIFCGIAAFTNIVFLFFPFILKFWPRRVPLLIFAGISSFGLLCGLIAPISIVNHFLIGYYVWLVGCISFLCSIAIAMFNAPNQGIFLES